MFTFVFLSLALSGCLPWDGSWLGWRVLWPWGVCWSFWLVWCYTWAFDPFHSWKYLEWLPGLLARSAQGYQYNWRSSPLMSLFVYDWTLCPTDLEYIPISLDVARLAAKCYGIVGCIYLNVNKIIFPFLQFWEHVHGFLYFLLARMAACLCFSFWPCIFDVLWCLT